MSDVPTRLQMSERLILIFIEMFGCVPSRANDKWIVCGFRGSLLPERSDCSFGSMLKVVAASIVVPRSAAS